MIIRYRDSFDAWIGEDGENEYSWYNISDVIAPEFDFIDIKHEW